MPVHPMPVTYNREAISWLQRQLLWERTFDRLRSPEEAPLLPDLDQAA